jgi:hypothetical protein
MRLSHQSHRDSRDSLVIGQNIFFACGLSQSVWRTGALHSPHDSEHGENWGVEPAQHAPTRLAGGSTRQPQLAESVSATCRASRHCHGSLAACHRHR